jgi:hypothetical protein
MREKYNKHATNEASHGHPPQVIEATTMNLIVES